jgi:hypothetical protein
VPGSRNNRLSGRIIPVELKNLGFNVKVSQGYLTLGQVAKQCKACKEGGELARSSPVKQQYSQGASRVKVARLPFA